MVLLELSLATKLLMDLTQMVSLIFITVSSSLNCSNSGTSGQRFDEYGNFANWWTESSQAEFDKQARCFAEQYSKYRVKAGQASFEQTLLIVLLYCAVSFISDTQVDGNLTLSENITDNGGLALSYLV